MFTRFINQLTSKEIKPGLLLAAYLGLFYFGLTDNGRGPAYPKIIHDLSLSNRQGSLLFASSSFISFVITILAPWWLKFLDLISSLKMGVGFLVAASLLLGLGGELHSTFFFYGSGLFQGLGMGITGISFNLLIQKAIPRQFQRQGFSGLHATYGIASLLSPLFFNFFALWNQFFYALCLTGIFILMLPIKRHPIASGKQIENLESIPQKTSPFLLILLALMIGTYVASEVVISSRLVLFLEKYHQLTNAQAGNYLSFFFMSLMCGRLLFSFVKFPVSSEAILIGSLASTAILSYWGINNSPWALSLTGLTMSVFYPSFMDWLAGTFPQKFPKMASITLGAIGLHLTIMHLGFGELVQSWGLLKAMTLTLYLSLTSLLMTVLILIWKKWDKATFT